MGVDQVAGLEGDDHLHGLARDRQFSSEIAAQLALAGDAWAAPEELHELSRVATDPHVTAALATNESTPPDVLHDLSQRPGSTRLTLTNPSTPSAALAAFADSGDPELRELIGKHPNASLEVLAALAFDPIPAVRRAVADNPHTSLDLLARLALDDDLTVRAVTAMNEHCPPGPLERLASDDHELVRGCVAINARCPLELVEQLASDPHWQVRKDVASRADVPARIQASLSADPDARVRERVSREGTSFASPRVMPRPAVSTDDPALSAVPAGEPDVPSPNAEEVMATDAARGLDVDDIDKIAELYPRSGSTHAFWIFILSYVTLGVFYLYWAARTSSRLRRAQQQPSRDWRVGRRLAAAGLPLAAVALLLGIVGLAQGGAWEASLELMAAGLAPIWYVVSVVTLGNVGYRLAQDIRTVRVAAGEPWYRVSAARWALVVGLLVPMIFVPFVQVAQVRRLVDTHGSGFLRRRPDSGPRPLEYWYAEVTHLDEPSSKERPVLVLARSDSDAWVLKVSSQDKTDRAAYWRRIDNSGWDRAGEGKRSWLELDAVHAVPVSRFRRYLGTETDHELIEDLTARHPNHLGRRTPVG